MRKLFLVSTLLLSTPLSAEEHYFRGFLEVGSMGICGAGSGECHSYLNVENVIADVCTRKPKSLKVAGHSYGASAALKLSWKATLCGVKVTHGIFLDPPVHPYNMPKAMKWEALYGWSFWGNGEGKAKSLKTSNSHLSITFNEDTMSYVRRFLNQ